MAKKRPHWLVYCAVVSIALLSIFISNGEFVSVYLTPAESSKQTIELHRNVVVKPELTQATALNKHPVSHGADHYCNMDGFIKKQQQRAKHLQSMLSAEFKQTQHVFSVNSGPTVILSVYYTQLSELALDMIIERLSMVHDMYSQLLPNSQGKTVTLNLIVLSDRTQYEDYTSRYGFDPRTSQGVFFHGSNSAFVEFKNDKQVIKTAIHEAIHAMNLRLIGLTPRWLNEGMAQLFSSIEMQNGELVFAVEKKALSLESHDIYSLLASESQWESIDTNKLYYSGWSWLRFMMGDEQGAKTMAHLLRLESSNPCNVLSADETYQLLQGAFPTFEQAFYDWQQRLDRSAQ
ncbi:hypothetical protein [Pseudoalteromonas sp. A25]|uniref:hypothetical protein n=1 Tax=Pseudoalteromonas sp. A25 TaxID=116092 RepID=UPI0012607123|nr:hypothetical protein [Pseudoalteromonas sp. A25]